MTFKIKPIEEEKPGILDNMPIDPPSAQRISYYVIEFLNCLGECPLTVSHTLELIQEESNAPEQIKQNAALVLKALFPED